LYGGNFTVAPVSVLVDPVRGLRAFGLDDGGTYSDDVIYIYKKQLEEADLIVISKCDLLDARRLAALRTAIAAHFPHKKILAVSSREGTNLDEWFGIITSETQVSGRAMDVDYGVYARGEALLGWLNCTVQITAGEAFDGNAFLSQLAAAIQERLRGAKAEVAHLKMTLAPEDGKGEIAVVNLVRNDFVPELSIRLEKSMHRGQLIINVRAEAAPDVLGTTVRESLAAAAGKFATMQATLDHLEHFRPGKPMPTHRSGELTV
jgi:G3E family GTPase